MNILLNIIKNEIKAIQALIRALAVNYRRSTDTFTYLNEWTEQLVKRRTPSASLQVHCELFQLVPWQDQHGC